MYFFPARGEHDRGTGAAAGRGSNGCTLLAADQRADDRAASRRRADFKGVLLLGRLRGASDRGRANPIALVVAPRDERVEPHADVREAFHLS